MFSAIWLLRKICKIIIAKIRKIIWSGQLAKGNRSRILNQVQTFYCTSSLYLTQLWLQVTDLSGRCQILRLSSLWRAFASRHQIHSDMKVLDYSSWKILRFFSKLPLSPLEDPMSICHHLSPCSGTCCRNSLDLCFSPSSLMRWMTSMNHPVKTPFICAGPPGASKPEILKGCNGHASRVNNGGAPRDGVTSNGQPY